mgnify:CR=1 FL=1
MPHVVAFRVRVGAAARCFKLSQDMPAAVRQRVRDDVRTTVPDGHRLADFMARVEPLSR